MSSFRKSFAIALLLALIYPVALHSQQTAVIPPGQEETIQNIFDPPSDLLPDGVGLDSIEIRSGEVLLKFTGSRGESIAFSVFPSKQEAGARDCVDAEHLRLCLIRGEKPEWLKIYRDFIAAEDRSGRAAKVWKETAKEKFKAPPEDIVPSPAPVFWPVMWSVLIMLGIWFKRPRPGRSGEDAAENWIRFTVAFAFGAATILLIACNFTDRFPLWPFIIWFLFSAAFAWRCVLKRIQKPSGILKGFRQSGFFWFLLFAAIMLVWLSRGFEMPRLIFGPLFEAIHRPWLPYDSWRFFITVTMLFLLFGSTLVIAFYCLYRGGKEDFRKVIQTALIGACLAFIPAWSIITQLGYLNPDSIWLEFRPGLWFYDGAFPYSEQLPAAGFLGGLALKILGFNSISWNLFKLLALLLLGSCLALTTRIFLKSLPPVILAGLAVAFYPAMPVLATEGWWFFLGLSFIAAAAGAMRISVKRNDELLLILALLLMQCAFEIRTEALILFPLYYLIQATYGFPHARYGKWITALFCFNLLRIIFIYSDEARIGDDFLIQNAIRYSEALGELSIFLIASAAGLWLASGRFRKDTLVLATWILGISGFYLFAATVPSFRELFVLMAPAFVLSGAIVSRPLLKSKTIDIILRSTAAVGIVAVMFIFSQSERSVWEKRNDEALTLDEHVRHLIEKVPVEVPILIEPAYLRLAFPERKALEEAPRRPGPKELRQIFADTLAVACLNRSGGEEMCCFYEIERPDIDSRYDKTPCWPVSLLGRHPRTLAEIDDVRVLILEKDAKEPLEK